MKLKIILLAAIALSSCHSYKAGKSLYEPIVGVWEQTNINPDSDTSGNPRRVLLQFRANGVYHYEYSQVDYKYEQSGKYKYMPKADSIVLYNYFPDAYTKESKNVRWSIRKLTPDTLTVYVHKNIVVHDNDTLNTAGNEIETYTRNKSIN